MEATATRTTQTATTPDGATHAYIVANGKTRCSAEGELVRTGRKPFSAVDCQACRVELPGAPAAAPAAPVPTAPSVSALLRRAGFNPVATRNREGVRVTRTALAGAVRVAADLDAPGAAERMIVDVAGVLTGAGYAVLPVEGHALVVTRTF